MSHLKTLRAGVCLSALFVGQAASADVTAQEVWDSWKSMIGIYGENGVTIGSETMSGDTLTVSGLTLSMEDGASSVSADLGELQFTENGDGTVSVITAPTSTINVVDEFGATIAMSTSQVGMSILVSGDPDAMNYAISADQYTVSVDSIDDPNEDMQGEMRFTMNDLSGDYTVTDQDALRDMAVTLNVASIDVLADMAEQTSDFTMLLSGKSNGLFLNAAVTLPTDMSEDMPEDEVIAFLQNDFRVAANYGLTDTTYLFDVGDVGERAEGTAAIGAVNVEIGYDGTRVGYDVAVNDVSVETSVPDFPFPINASIAQYGIKVDLPLRQTDEAVDFGFGFNLTEVAVNDEIWMLGDPTNAIPHDPVTIALDLTGSAKVLVDLFDPESMAAVDAGAMMPGEIYGLDLNTLTVKAAGAAVDGTGGFTFDNSDLTTIPGVPRPEGEITVNIDGANALIDSLVAIGLVPEDQAMMGRMMMGMFARTVGEDQLTSTIEINDQGHILANGQRIQ